MKSAAGIGARPDRLVEPAVERDALLGRHAHRRYRPPVAVAVDGPLLPGLHGRDTAEGVGEKTEKARDFSPRKHHETHFSLEGSAAVSVQYDKRRHAVDRRWPQAFREAGLGACVRRAVALSAGGPIGQSACCGPREAEVGGGGGERRGCHGPRRHGGTEAELDSSCLTWYSNQLSAPVRQGRWRRVDRRRRYPDAIRATPMVHSCRAGVAELADARDLKSRAPKGACGFDSRPRHSGLAWRGLRAQGT